MFCDPPECEDMKWYDSEWVCQEAIPNCDEKENLSGCKKCRGNGILVEASPN